MQNIIIGRYDEITSEEKKKWSKNIREVISVSDEWQGWIEPEDRSWILFIRKDGTPFLFPNRNKKTGAVLD